MTTGAPPHRRTAAPCWILRASVPLCLCASLFSCRRDQVEAQTDAQNQQNDVPVVINGESPFQYPIQLYDQGIEGEVRLRLWVDSTGHIAAESTRVTSSSGTPGLDSAAVAGSALLLFAPAHRDGRPVAAAFYQPVIFRRRAAATGAPIQ